MAAQRRSCRGKVLPASKHITAGDVMRFKNQVPGAKLRYKPEHRVFVMYTTHGEVAERHLHKLLASFPDQVIYV
jgi:hypothetical protein